MCSRILKKNFVAKRWNQISTCIVFLIVSQWFSSGAELACFWIKVTPHHSSHSLTLAIHMLDEKFRLPINSKVLIQLSCLITKPTEWHVHPAKTLIRLGGCPGWSESLLGAHAKSLIKLGGCPGWSESLLGAHAILLVLSWGSINYALSKQSRFRRDCFWGMHLLDSLLHVKQWHNVILLQF